MRIFEVNFELTKIIFSPRVKLGYIALIELNERVLLSLVRGKWGTVIAPQTRKFEPLLMEEWTPCP